MTSPIDPIVRPDIIVPDTTPHFRRVATRYDKLAQNYLSAVALAAVRLWTRFESTT